MPSSHPCSSSRVARDRLVPVGAGHVDVRRYSRARRNLLPRSDHVTTVVGRHTVRWIWSQPAHAYTDVFDVQDEAPPAILSFASVVSFTRPTAFRSQATCVSPGRGTIRQKKTE